MYFINPITFSGRAIFGGGSSRTQTDGWETLAKLLLFFFFSLDKEAPRCHGDRTPPPHEVRTCHRVPDTLWALS